MGIGINVEAVLVPRYQRLEDRPDLISQPKPVGPSARNWKYNSCYSFKHRVRGYT